MQHLIRSLEPIARKSFGENRDLSLNACHVEAKKEVKLNIVDQYLQAACFYKISKSDLKKILDYEVKADPIEKKLIKRIRDQVERGRITLSIREAKKI